MDLSEDQLLYLVRLYYEKLELPSRRQVAYAVRWLSVDVLIESKLVTVSAVGNDLFYTLTDKGMDVLHSYPKSMWMMLLIAEGMWSEAKFFMHSLTKEELVAFLVHEYDVVREIAKQQWDVLDYNDRRSSNAKITYRL